MILKSVDLPQPDGPITPTNSPGATDSETPSTAVTTPSGVSNDLTMLSTARMAPPAATSGPDGLTAVNAVATAMRLPSLRYPKNMGCAGPYSTSRLAAAPATADQKCRCRCWRRILRPIPPDRVGRLAG